MSRTKKLSPTETAYREFRASLGDITVPDVPAGGLGSRYERPYKQTKTALAKRRKRESR